MFRVPFADFIEYHHGSFQVFVKNKSEEIELFKTLFNAGLAKNDMVMEHIDILLSESNVRNYPRQDLFKTFILDGEYRYLFGGWTSGRGGFSDLYNKTYTPYSFEEVMEYYLGLRDQQLNLEVTNDDLLCLM